MLGLGSNVSFCPTGNAPGPMEPASEEAGKGGMSVGPDISNGRAIVLQGAVTAERGLVPPRDPLSEASLGRSERCLQT